MHACFYPYLKILLKFKIPLYQMTNFIKDGDPLGLKLLQDAFESLPPKNLSLEFVSKLCKLVREHRYMFKEEYWFIILRSIC